MHSFHFFFAIEKVTPLGIIANPGKCSLTTLNLMVRGRRGIFPYPGAYHTERCLQNPPPTAYTLFTSFFAIEKVTRPLGIMAVTVDAPLITLNPMVRRREGMFPYPGAIPRGRNRVGEGMGGRKYLQKLLPGFRVRPLPAHFHSAG